MEELYTYTLTGEEAMMIGHSLTKEAVALEARGEIESEYVTLADHIFSELPLEIEVEA